MHGLIEKLQNLRDKAALEHPTLGSFPLSEDEILSSVVGYEIFKLKSYVTSGVFPKKLDQEKIDSSTDWKSFDLMSYPLAEQFITSSLVFNSGILFKNQTVDRIRDFDLIGYLHNVSEKSANKKGEAWRPRLPVDSSHRQAFELVVDRGYREQPTSWQAAYRVLQRYGAYVAVKRFMAIVDEDDMLSLDFSPAF